MSIFRYILALAVSFAVSGALHAMEPVAYGDLSDEELQALVERLEKLDVEERRAITTEINRRTRTERGVVRVESERRYGYRVRRPDGSVVTVQRRQKIIRYVDPNQPYGVGFEERVGSGPAPIPPVERVNHQNATSP
ncbi:MAG: hypothetical protein V3U43_07650 [Pseudomonadales bacterium]